MRKILLVLLLAAAPLAAQSVPADSATQPWSDVTELAHRHKTLYDNQPRLLFGVEGGGLFGNYFLSGNIGTEFPIKKYGELDFMEEFSPVESHISLGHGIANDLHYGGRVWVRRNLGLYGSVSQSQYSVTRAAKSNDYVWAGLTWRKIAWENPTRFTFSYIQEFNNGVSANGTETSHLKGGDFTLDTNLGCGHGLCYRWTVSFEAGHVLQQGNPVCDGSEGRPKCVAPCPRLGAVGGGAKLGLLFVFPRHKGYDEAVF